METSTDIALLADALAKAQGTMGGALKDSTNPFFKSKYADLESVWNACRKALSENGLSVIQTVTADDVKTYVTTILAHSSGQWVRETLPLNPKEMTPQGIGSCISYGRRYALAAIVGVYQTDDDAEAGHGRSNGGIKQPTNDDRNVLVNVIARDARSPPAIANDDGTPTGPEYIPSGKHKGKQWAEASRLWLDKAIHAKNSAPEIVAGAKRECARRDAIFQTGMAAPEGDIPYGDEDVRPPAE